MTHYAVLIGNGKFPKETNTERLPSLSSPLHDIRGLQAALTDEKHGLFQPEHIVLLENETREVILEKVGDLLSNAKKEDLVLLYYSGHGWRDNNDRLYLTALNTQIDRLRVHSISFGELYSSIQESDCNKKIVILDCCYSGAAIDGVLKGDEDIALAASLKKINATAEGTYLLTASASLQSANATSDGSDYSLFTHHLIDGLKGKAKADEQGLIPLDNLFDYVEDAVKTISSQKTPDGKLRRPQIPLLAAPRVKGTLHLAKSGRDSRKERAKEIANYLYGLAQQERISHEILTEAVSIMGKKPEDLSETEQVKDELISACFKNRTPLNFVTEWVKLDLVQANIKQLEVAKQAEAQRIRLEQETEAAKRAAAQREKEKQTAVAKQLAENQRLEAEAAKKVADEQRRKDEEAAKRAEQIKRADDLIKAEQAERAQREKEATAKQLAETKRLEAAKKLAAEEKRRKEAEAAKRAEEIKRAEDLIKTEQAERAQREKQATQQAAEAREAARLAALAEAAKNPNPPLKTPVNKKGIYAIAVMVGAGIWLASGKSPKKPVELPVVPPVSPAVIEAPVAMVNIPAGSFIMGSCKEAGSCLSGTSVDSEAYSNEAPQRQVQIAAFELGKTEVTVGQFRAFVKATAYRTDAEKDTGGNKGCYAWDASDGKWDWRAGYYWDKVGFSQSEQHPVACVSWNDAQAFITWLNSKTQAGYRLPSEAEWEYAARAGTTTRRYWGDDADQACAYANVADKTTGPNGHSWTTKHECSDGQFFSAAVGSYKPNEFKLHDMLGNVWEWTQDPSHSDYNGAPTDGSVWQGSGGARVLRGGSWGINPQSVRAAYRSRNDASNRNFNVGFRLARTLP